MVGENNPKLQNLVGNTGQNEKYKSQIYGHLEHFLIAHAAFLDSGSFCKTKIAKK